MTLQKTEVKYFRSLDDVLQRDGFVIFIEGGKEEGKTDFALLLLEYCIHKRYRQLFATNIRAQTPDYAIRQITNFPDLEVWLKKRGKKIFILDEGGDHLGKMRFMTKKNISFLAKVQKIRHYDCGLIVIAPSENFIDTHLLGKEILDVKIRKVNKTIAKIYNYLFKEWFTLYNIPATSISFNSKDDAIFNLQKPKYDKKSGKKETRICCIVARLYAEGNSYADIVREKYPAQTRMWVMRKVREHLQH